MTTKIDITKLEFSSSAFPSEADLKLWNSLTPQQQHERQLFELQKAKDSGVAPAETFAERLVRLKKQRALSA